VHDAREAESRAEVDVDRALAWRDFMVSNYSDAGQERWLADNGIDLLRGTGRLAGPGVVEVDGARHTADHVVLANGADPIIPPVPGLRELEGIWTNREVTGMRAIPRRLLVLGGGPVGVEMAQAVRRLGGEVVVVEGAEHLLPREPAPAGFANSPGAPRGYGSLASSPLPWSTEARLLWSLADLVARNLFALVWLVAPSRRSKEIEILVLRHEMAILRRQTSRPRLTRADRTLLASLSRSLGRPAWAVFPIKPDTLLRWHRQLIARGVRGRAPGRICK
jgi:Pyridine nucleotide-disulphide oxidoreductase